MSGGSQMDVNTIFDQVAASIEIPEGLAEQIRDCTQSM